MCVGDDAGEIFHISFVNLDVFLSVTYAVIHRFGQSNPRIDRYSIVDLVGSVAKAPISHLSSDVRLEI